MSHSIKAKCPGCLNRATFLSDDKRPDHLLHCNICGHIEGFCIPGNDEEDTAGGSDE